MTSPRPPFIKPILIHLAVVLLVVSGSGVSPPAVYGQAAAEARLQYVATARQIGPVGYRDPLGVMSPDGVWLAYTAGTRLYLQRTGGGPVTALGPGSTPSRTWPGSLTADAWPSGSVSSTGAQRTG